MIDRKLLVSLMVVGIVGAVAAGSGTLALFSDEEASTGNTFAAGEVNLQVGWDESVTSEALRPVEDQELTDEPGPIFEFEDIKPGDGGEATIHLHEFGNDAWVWWRLNPRDFDDTRVEPEFDAGDETFGPGEGELQEKLRFTIWYDGHEEDVGSGPETVGNNVYDEEEERLIFNGTVDELDDPGSYTYSSILMNEGFEQPIVNASEGWNIFTESEISDWDIEWVGSPPSDSGCTVDEPVLEYHREVQGWSDTEGEQYVELDSDCDGPGGGVNGEQASVSISQDRTIPGREYRLTYMYSPRPGNGDNEMEVAVDGDLKNTHSVSGSGLQDTDWRQGTVVFNATEDPTTISFTETGPEDSMGMFLDEVTLTDRTGTLEDGIIIDGDTEDAVTDEFEASTDHYIGFKWKFPRDAGNIYQKDSVTADFNFFAEQFRNNNPDPSNPFPLD